MTHHEIASAFMIQLGNRGMNSLAVESASGSVYVYIIGGRQRVRIADHGKHRGWFRYNIRTDLKKSRSFMFRGQRVFIFTPNELKQACFRILQDSKNDRVKFGNAIITKKSARRR